VSNAELAPRDEPGEQHPPPEEEGAEADLLDQIRVVDEEQVVEHARQPPDANEADWFEQRIAEPIDDELR
jgi:hypothetical protein